jgi:malate dehydrogenase (oxaloacetate-decarboxylating)
LAEVTNKENVQGDLAQAIKGSDVFIGASVAGVLTKAMVESMNSQPIIFALANPIPEIMPDVAKEAGALVVATGRSDFANQINNVLVFPGVFRGALDNKVKTITNQMLIRVAEALAGMIIDPNPELIIPSPLNKDVVGLVASQIYE